MLALGRGLMSRPLLILLDEPSPRISSSFSQRIVFFHANIRKEGVTILLVEQNATMALKVCDYVYLLETGCGKSSRDSRRSVVSEDVKKVYLGG